MNKRKLSEAELLKQLNAQIGALQRSTQLFDEGYTLEATKIAVTLRVILHSGKYPSLLKQLGRENTDFIDTSIPFDPANLLSFHGLVGLSFKEGEVSYSVKLDDETPNQKTSFDEWWDATVFADNQGFKLTRSDVVLTASNQDGGAHVDGSLRGDYASLRFENSLGWITDKAAPPHGDPVYSAIRQVAHEVLKTLLPDYSKTREDVRAILKDSQISGGKLRFYPHEKKFFINEMTRPLTPTLSYLAE